LCCRAFLLEACRQTLYDVFSAGRNVALQICAAAMKLSLARRLLYTGSDSADVGYLVFSRIRTVTCNATLQRGQKTEGGLPKFNLSLQKNTGCSFSAVRVSW
jgi:hypothetical protein